MSYIEKTSLSSPVEIPTPPNLGVLLNLSKDETNSFEIFGNFILDKCKNITTLVITKLDPIENRLHPTFVHGLGKNEHYWIKPEIVNYVRYERNIVKTFSFDPIDNVNYAQIFLPIMTANKFFGILNLEMEAELENELKAHSNFICTSLKTLDIYLQNSTTENIVNELTPEMTRSFLSLIQAKDTYTAGHCERVADFSNLIAKQIGFSKPELKELICSALIHDVGKIGIPDDILKKPGSLTHEEYNIMMLHSHLGHQSVRNLGLSKEILSGVYLHHEKWDGTGYPCGLAGEEIPVFARIIAVADALDAMTSGRSYSGFMDIGTAVSDLSEKSDLFDPYILKALRSIYRKGLLQKNVNTVIMDVYS